MRLLRCALYLAVLGIVSFFLGRLLSRLPFRWDEAPFRPFSFEKNGRIYEKLGVKKWQNRVPDMSRILPMLMPAKRMDGVTPEMLPVMIRETCVAEAVHVLLCAAGLPCLAIWPGAGGVTVTVLYILLGNVPFIVIQRYNRPRLVIYWQRCQREEQRNRIVRSEEVQTPSAYFNT